MKLIDSWACPLGVIANTKEIIRLKKIILLPNANVPIDNASFKR